MPTVTEKLLANRMEKIPRNDMFSPDLWEKSSFCYWYWWILYLVFHEEGRKMKAPNRTARVGKQKRPCLCASCLTKPPSVTEALRWVLDSRMGTFVHCLQPVSCRPFVRGWELTDSKREKGNIKVGIKRLKIIVSKGGRKGKKKKEKWKWEGH